MAEYLRIQARLPKAAGFELGARLLASRPEWDVEVEEGGLECFIPLIPGQVDAELTVVEESCRAVERSRFENLVDLTVSRTFDLPRVDPPPALGTWRLRKRPENGHQAEPAPDELIWPGPWPAARRWWIGEELLLTLISDHLTPPPGAPETRGRPTLFLTPMPSAGAPAAVRGGTGPLTLIGPEALQRATRELLAANGHHHAEPEAAEQPFTVLARKRDDWHGHFGLIVVHLSPYLAARRLRALAVWLAPEGALLVSGFAPGAQTAHLLRAAARAGLELAASLVVGEWGAMRLVRIPEREVLPPLTGSVVPDLVEPPDEPFCLEPDQQ